MGEIWDDPYAARRGELEREFQSLPMAGTTAYWQRIEPFDPRHALALEVLARCLRERMAAGDLLGEQRILDMILGRIQSRTARWAEHMARGAQGLDADDLAEEVYVEVWRALINPRQVFLLENFLHALDRMQQHVAAALLLKSGAMRRSGVTHSTRVPTGQMDSLDAPPRADDQVPLSERLADPHATDDFERAELSDLMLLLERLPADQRSIVHARFVLDHSAEEIAARQGVTPRTVRNWLKTSLDTLRRAYSGGEEVEHGSHA